MAKRVSLPSVPEASPGNYGALLDHHIMAGTCSAPAHVIGKPLKWERANKTQFAAALGVTDRLVREWIANGAAPKPHNHLKVLSLLVGSDPAHAKSKTDLDAAYSLRKYGNGNGG